MDFKFSAEQRAMRDSMRELLTDHCPPDVVRGFRNQSTQLAGTALWRELQSVGVPGLLASEAIGGSDLTVVDSILVFTELGYAAAPGPILEHVAVAVPALAAATDIGSLSAEAAAGNVVLTAGLERDGWVPWPDQSVAIVSVATDEVRLVRRPTELSVSTSVTDPAWRGVPFAQLAGAGQLLDDVSPTWLANLGALAASAELLGLADRMLAMTLDYVKQRVQFGRPVGSYQAVKHHLADARTALEFARPVVYRAAVSVHGGALYVDRDVSMAKYLAGEAATCTARLAHQCHGAIAHTEEYDLSLWMKRTWVLANSWGDTRYHLSRIERATLGDRVASQ